MNRLFPRQTGAGTASRRLKMIPGAAVVLLVACKATVVHKVDPIHITLDVNLKVDRELDQFFDFQREIEREVLDEEEPGTPAPPAASEGDASQ